MFFVNHRHPNGGPLFNNVDLGACRGELPVEVLIGGRGNVSHSDHGIEACV